VPLSLGMILFMLIAGLLAMKLSEKKESAVQAGCVIAWSDSSTPAVRSLDFWLFVGYIVAQRRKRL
jgi:hypothetical protein